MRNKRLLFIVALTFLFLGSTKVLADSPATVTNSHDAIINVLVPSDPGDKYNEWYYKYTAQPYDFYYNPYIQGNLENGSSNFDNRTFGQNYI